MNRPACPKLSPAERAHLIVLQQEAKRERLERRVEREMNEYATIREVMEGEVIVRPHGLHHHGTQWECAELDRINQNRPASRICFSLPLGRYEAKACARYLPDA